MEDNLIRIELFKNIEAFTNEIDLTMELKNGVVSSIKTYMKSVNKNKDLFNKFVEYNTNHLKMFEVQISSVLFSNKKLKSDYYNFLNDIVLFDNLLSFKVFENESKNTKKDLIKYLYSIYMASVFLQGDESKRSVHERLNDFVLKIKSDAETLKEDDIKQQKTTKTKRRNALVVDDSMKNIIENFKETNVDMGMKNIIKNFKETNNNGTFGEDNLDMKNIMESILGNKEILNIATDISQKMQSQNLNPMEMLTSLMSGNIENSPLQGLVEEIQQKVDTKINNGEINKEKLENQAKNIMGSIGSNPTALDSISGMSELIGNMINNMKN